MNVLIVFLLGGLELRHLYFGKIKVGHRKTMKNSYNTSM